MGVAGYFPPAELEHILAALMPPNRLALEVSLATGLRISDVLNLRTADLRSPMQVRELKTGKRRRITLKRALLDSLLSQAGKIWVFEGRRDYRKHRTRQAVYKDLIRAAHLFRLPADVHISPHTMRKVYAVGKFGRSAGDLAKVQRALNHASPAVTALYVMSGELYERNKAKRERRATHG